MRTTLSLDPDVDELLRTTMAERGISFKEAVNAAIRAGQRSQFTLAHIDKGERVRSDMSEAFHTLSTPRAGWPRHLASPAVPPPSLSC